MNNCHFLPPFPCSPSRVIFRLAAKVGLAGGAMYWTVQQGLWGTAEEGVAAGKKFAAAVMPSTVEYLDKVQTNRTFTNMTAIVKIKSKREQDILLKLSSLQ